MKQANHPEKEIVEHWYSLVAAHRFSAKEFYARVEGEIRAQQVPGLEISRIDLSEGGILSDNREYLRMKRERLTFDVCAAPVGVNYFFSYRFYVEPAIVRPWEVLVLAAALAAVIRGSAQLAGPFAGPLLLFTALGILGWTMRNAIGMGMRDLDATLLKIPVIAPVYERYFRKDSYYRQDLRTAYCTIVSSIVKHEAETLMASKGVLLLREYSYSRDEAGIKAARTAALRREGAADEPVIA